jgi:hypothetical protein
MPGPSSVTVMRARRLSGIQNRLQGHLARAAHRLHRVVHGFSTARLIWSGSTSTRGMSGEKLTLMSRAACDSR